jgi:putative transposase
VTVLVDAARSLIAALAYLGYRYRVARAGPRTYVERVFRERKRRTSSFSNTFSHAHPTTAEPWLQASPPGGGSVQIRSEG